MRVELLTALEWTPSVSAHSQPRPFQPRYSETKVGDRALRPRDGRRPRGTGRWFGFVKKKAL